MNAKVLSCVAVTSATILSAHADVFIDEFSGASLNPLWTLADAPENYAAGGGFGLVAGKAKFQQIKAETYGNLRIPIGILDGDDTARVDASQRMEQFNTGRWSPGVAIYFGNDNWIQLRHAYENGQEGWVRQGVVEGNQVDLGDNPAADMRFLFGIASVELTPTQIKFYGTPVGSDHSTATSDQIDSLVQLIPELTMARPASFTGQAHAIIGKGYGFSGFNMNSPFLTNSTGGYLDPADNYIDFARVTGITLPAPGWTINASGDWNNAGNWNGPVPNAVDATATFGNAISSARTVYTDTPITVGTLLFNNANTYQLAGNGVLTLDVSAGSAQVSVLQGSHKINLPSVFADNTNVNVAGGATLIIANPATIQANKTVTKTGNVLIQAPLTIEAGGGLNLVSGSTTLFGTPSLGAGASVNVQNNGVTIDYRGQASPAATVKAQLLAGYAGGAWTGAGFKTSAAVANQTGLGWRENAAGESIAIEYTYYGDTNLTGTVDSTDFSEFVAAYGLTTGAIWAQGDFDYDGKVNTRDFNYLAGNFGKPAIPGAIPAPALGAVVPEPATTSVLLAGLAGLFARRHRARTTASC